MVSHINLKKWVFSVPTLEILGHMISATGSAPTAGHAAAIKSSPPPRTSSNCSVFPARWTFTAVSCQLCTGVVPFNRSPEGGGGWAKTLEVDRYGTVGFPKCKMPPSHGSASSAPLPQAELSLATDASDTHIGSVMQQKSGDHWRPLGFFFSKLTTPGSLDLPPLVLNTPWSPNSPVMKTPGSQLLSVLWTSIRTTFQKKNPVYSTSGNWDSLVYSSLGSLFGHWGVILPILRSIKQSLKGLSFYEWTVGYFNYLGTFDASLQKLPNLRDSNRLPGVFFTGESVRIRITPQIFEKIWHRFWAWILGLGEVVWWKKLETKNLVTLFFFKKSKSMQALLSLFVKIIVSQICFKNNDDN